MTLLVVSFTPGADRSNFSGNVGYSFVPTANMLVTQLGVRKATGNTGARTISLSNAAGTVLTSASIDVTVGTVGTFIYAACTAAALIAGTTYYLSQAVTSGGQVWADQGATTVTGAGSETSVFTSGAIGSWSNGTANTQFVGLDLSFDPVALPPSGALAFTGFAPTSTGGITSTQARFTQVGAEAWVSNTPAAAFTQIGAEAWVSNKPAMVVSQIGVEVWRSVIDGAVPPSGHITFTGFAPSASFDTPVAAGHITFTGFAPAPADIALPGAGALVFSGFAPNIDIASLPAAGSIVFTGFAPTTSDRATPGAGSIVFAGAAPSNDFTLTPGAGLINFTGFAPISSDAAAPGVGLLAFTGFAPTPAFSSASAPMFSVII